MSAVRARLSYANVMSTIAVFIALGGTSYAVARNSVGTAQLRKNAVTSSKVKDRSLRRSDLASGIRGLRGPRGPQGPTGSVAAGALQPEPWQSLSLIGGWKDYPRYEGAGYRKDKQGQVHLRGLVQHPDGPASQSAIIGVLPAGYRPARRQVFTSNGGALDAYTRVDIVPDGSITWVVGPTSDPSYSTTLSGLTFWPD